MRISDLLSGEIVEATAPTAMVAGTHHSLSYDGEAGELVFLRLQEPSSEVAIGNYVLQPHPRDPEISVPVDGPFPYRVEFTPFTHPRAWRGQEGVALWDASILVGAKGLDGLMGRLRPTVVSISTDQSFTVPASHWSYEEITDFTEAGGVSGLFEITVTPEVSPPAGLALYAVATGLPYVPSNYAQIHAAAVPAEIGGTVVAPSGLAAGAQAYLLLLWFDNTLDAILPWRRASANIETPTVHGVVDPLKPVFTQRPVITAPGGIARIGQAVSGSYAVTGSVGSHAIQWLRDTFEIFGATSLNYTPVPADDLQPLRLRVRASNSNGTTEEISQPLTVRYVPPQATGSLADVTVDQETGATFSFEAGPEFTGDALVFSISGNAAATIDSDGTVAIDRSNVVAATTITVAVTNSGGSASLTFTLQINEAPDDIVWPADIPSNLWSAAEVTDPAEASANGFPGEDYHIKATFNGSIDENPTDFLLYWTPFGANPGTSSPAVVPGTTQYSAGVGSQGTIYTPKLWWKHTPTGAFKLAGTHAALPALQGLDVEPPDEDHPRTVYSAGDLITIKARVAAGTQPQRNAWLNTVLPAANSALNFTADPDASYGFLNPGSQQGYVGYSRAEFTRNGRAAYASALAWRQTGDTRYANKAVQIMDAWARRSPQMEPDGKSHPGLHIASHLTQMLYAVDLMRGYTPWENVHQRFETWWRNEPMRNVRAVITEKMPGWPGNRQQVINNPNSETIWEGTNWLDHAMNCMLTAGTVFDDADLVDEFCDRLSDYFIANWRIKKYPYGPGGASVACMVRDVNRVSNGELTGVSYTGYGTSSTVQALTTALHHGVNLFNRKTPQGVGYQEVIEQWFRWNYLREEFRGTTNYEREATTHTNILEVAHTRWNMSTQFKNFVVNNRPWSNGLMESYPSYVNVKAAE